MNLHEYQGVGIASGLSRLSGVLAPLVSSGLLAVSSGITLLILVDFSLMAVHIRRSSSSYRTDSHCSQAAACFMVALPIRTKGRALE